MTLPARIGAALSMVALISGCGIDALAGNPVPAADEIRTGNTPAHSRPRELKLDNKDPCRLVPTSDWVKFHIEKPGKSERDESLKSPECLYSNSVGEFDITLVVSEDIEAWRSGQRAAKPTEVAAINGFPTISLRRPEDQIGCAVAVDVADGQYLLATVIIDSGKDAQLPEHCAYAHQLAESAMSTLVAS